MTVGVSGLTTVPLDHVTLDRSSPVPLYFQLATQLEAAIDRGDLAAGARLDNEIELADRLGVSRPTMRRAIQELVSKGLLVRKRGVGTQVVQGGLKRRVELTSLYDDLAKSRREPSTEVLTVDFVPADGEVAQALGVAHEEQVVYLERLRKADGTPLAVMRNWLPADLAPNEEQLRTRGLYDLMRGMGIHLRIATQRIGAAGATAAQAKLLEVRKGAPLLTMERVTYDDSGRPVELGRHVYRSEAYSFEITLVDR
jgi:DNA-binding GntR family transcriptional regulator